MTKLAWITGAAGGVGQAISRNFVDKGYQVVLIDREKEKLAAQCQKLSDQYQLPKERVPVSYALDVTNKDQVHHAFQEVKSRFGRIDVLFNNAGIARLGGSSMRYADFNEIIQVNLFGIFNCIYEIAPLMKNQGTGYIFNVASRQGKMAGANLAGYASSKFAVVGLSESICKELIAYGIKVTALCPSYINTPMMDLLDFPRDEMLDPEDIVKTVNYLLSFSTPACVREVLIEIRKLV